MNIDVELEMQDQYMQNNVGKTMLWVLFKKKDEFNLIEKFCDWVSHVHIKLYSYSIIIRTIEQIGLRYRIKENEISNERTVFTLIVEPKKNKVIDLEIFYNELFCTSYNQLCIANFIPLLPKAKIMIREIESLIKTTIRIQQEYLNILKS